MGLRVRREEEEGLKEGFLKSRLMIELSSFWTLLFSSLFFRKHIWSLIRSISVCHPFSSTRTEEEGGIGGKDVGGGRKEEDWRRREEEVWRKVEEGGRKLEESGVGRMEEDMEGEGRREGRGLEIGAFRMDEWRSSSISYFLYSTENLVGWALGNRTFWSISVKGNRTFRAISVKKFVVFKYLPK